MRPSVALNEHRDEVKHIFSRHPQLCNPRIFGSVLYGTDKDGSDLDILIDVILGTGLLAIGSLLADLEDLLHVPIDLLTPNNLPPKFRDKVIKEAKKL